MEGGFYRRRPSINVLRSFFFRVLFFSPSPLIVLLLFWVPDEEKSVCIPWLSHRDRIPIYFSYLLRPIDLLQLKGPSSVCALFYVTHFLGKVLPSFPLLSFISILCISSLFLLQIPLFSLLLPAEAQYMFVVFSSAIGMTKGEMKGTKRLNFS